MLNGNLLKRVMPFLLSLAMAFQSVPMTALAAEIPQAVELTEEAETPAETAADPTDESTPANTSAEDSGNQDGADAGKDTETTPDTDAAGAQTGENTETTPDTDAAGTQTGENTETTPDADAADAQTGTDAPDAQAEVTSTEIIVDGVDISGFELDTLDTSKRTYTTQYGVRFDNVMNIVKDAAGTKILVNGENAKALKADYLTLEWREVKDGAVAAAAMNGTPVNVGSYALHLETIAVDGLCLKKEYNVYFNITPKKLTLGSNAINDVIGSVKAGSKVADLKKDVADASTLLIDGSAFTDLKYSVTVKVYKVGEETETTDVLFNKNGDSYKVKVEVAFDDAAAGANYELGGGEYLITFDSSLTNTKVEVTNPGGDLAAAYDAEKTYSASKFAADHNLTATVSAAGKNAAGEDVYEPLGADVKAVPGWFKKEIKDGSIKDFPVPETGDNTQFLDNGALYTLITDGEKKQEEVEVGEVGDYYLVFTYEGVEGQYAPSHSAPVKFTIDPIEVIIKPAEISAISTGMSDAGLKKALAEVSFGLWTPDAADASKAGAENADANAALKDEKDGKTFFGVSYDNVAVTQYYSPVFELVRKGRTRLDEKNWPANATEDQKWTKWEQKPVTSVSDLKEGETGKSEYKYYVKFTGQKAVYDTNGTKTSEKPIAEATDAANRNYKVKADDETLANENNMLEVQLTAAAKTEINVSDIIAAFNGEGGRGKGGAGLSSDAAWTIYDPDAALFADKESFKKAKVTGADPVVENTHKDLTYTWETGSMEQYYSILRMEKAEGEKDEEFAERKADAVKALEKSFTNDEDTKYTVPQNAGLYRLHVHYEDSSLEPKNAPADGYAYFLIKKQELIMVADTQFAEYGDDVLYFMPQDTYSVYLLPDNDETKLDQTKPLGWRADSDSVTWKAMNLKKNADGTDTAEWVESEGTFVESNPPYKYAAAVWLNNATGEIRDTENNQVKSDAGTPLYWNNYTTKNMAAWDKEAGDYKQHIDPTDIQFGAKKIQVVVDRTKMPANKVYNGVKSAAGLPEGLVKLTDAAGADIPATALQINGEPQDGVGIVDVAWKWLDFNGNDVDENNSVYVQPEEVTFGGTYRLVARFAGYTNADGSVVYAPYEDSDWAPLKDADGKTYDWTINPLKIEISPAVKETVTAGDELSAMVEDWHVIAAAVNEGEKIPDGTEENQEDDRYLFEVGSSVRNAYTGVEEEISGYPILGGTTFEEDYYADNKKVNKEPKNRIRFGKTYQVKLQESSLDNLYNQYQYSYDIAMKADGPKTIVRGDADVEGTDFYNGYREGYVSVYPQKGEGGYQIIPREGIPFVYKGADMPSDLITADKIPADRNYIAVKIFSPLEFSSEMAADQGYAKKNFVYRNSIHAAGGYVIQEADLTETDRTERYFITVLFPVEADDDSKIKEIPAFGVTWEKDYTDTFKFDMANAKLEANLKMAVAPKSLAFNGVQAKMAVGEEQQLDVKITKAQLGDVIRINYRLADENSKQYASIDPETGLLTALATANKKPTAVSVEAYPVRLAADGKTYEEITGKTVKIAKTKVTITEVTAPVIKKVIPRDTEVEVQFTKVNDGYRGEIYVKQFDNKQAANKYKAADFERDIAAMKNGQWKGTFAVKPKYFSVAECYVEKLKLCRNYVDKLEKGFYVIYVRNVSAVRTLADGTKTTESAAGTVKAFETTKSQVQALYPYFVVEDGEKSKANPVRYYGDDEDAQKDQKDNRESHEIAHYTVELADKSAQLAVEGNFLRKLTDPTADDEPLWLPLSLKIAEKQDSKKYTDTYLDPKLTYFVTDNVDPVFDINHKVLNPSKLVTINNKGKLTFKGVDLDGELTVRVYVQAYNGSSYDDAYTKSYCKLTITAKPTTITTKNPKTMKVGDAIRLRDYIEYKQGNNAKVPNYWSKDIAITDENWSAVEEAGFQIVQYDSSDIDTSNDVKRSINAELKDGEYVIIAKKAGAKCDLKFTDWLWSDSGKKQSDECKIALQTAALDPVKGLKTVYTDDRSMTINFSHPGHPEAFDIEVKDARGSVVYKRLAYRNDMKTLQADLTKDGWWPGNLKKLNSFDPVPAWYNTAITNLQRANLINATRDYDKKVPANFVYFEKTKTYAYTIDTDKLMRLSSYTVSVTPVYDGERAAKPITTKAKTTNIPASYADDVLTNPDYNFRGNGLSFNTNDNRTNNCYLVSGNTYTVNAYPDNYLAQSRGTDTLTWKSSNAKVASVKANQGSFSATLKALSQGKATITVTSKVTKKTIARYHIAVKAVGKADSYGGDYENGGNNGFFDEFITTVDPYYEGRMEVLTVSNPVHIDSTDRLDKDDPSYYGQNDRTWVKFTAPSYGQYTFKCRYGYGDNRDQWWYEYYEIFYNSGTESGNSTSGNTTLKLEEGQEIYFKVLSNYFTLSVDSWTDFTKLTASYTKEKPLKAGKNDVWVSFTATEENVYTFNGNAELSFEQNGNPVNLCYTKYKDGVYSYEKALKTGETIFIKVTANKTLWVTKREYAKTLTKGGSESLSITKDNKDEVQYVKFTADTTGEYSFTYSPKSKLDVTFCLQDGTVVSDGDTVVSEEIGRTRTMAEGDTAPDAPAQPDEKTIKLFIQAGETIVITVAVKAGFKGDIKDDASKIDVTVKSATPVGEAALTETAQTVAAKATQMFYYNIPDDTAATKYTLVTEGNPTVKWYYGRTERGKKLASLSAILGNGNTFTVEKGSVIEPKLTGKASLHADDKIYIEVTAMADADAKVSLTKATTAEKVFNETTPATVVLGATAGGAEWYTFTAKKTGYYEFTKEVTVAPTTSTAQSANVYTVNKAFDNSENYVVNMNDSTTVLKQLNAGSYVFRIAATSAAAAEGDKTTVKLSVKEIIPTVLTKGENAVAVTKGETKYYTFKRATSGQYTIKWEAGTDVGSPVVEYKRDENLEGGGYTELPSGGSIGFNNNDTYTIKVTADSEKDLTGKLLVSERAKKFLTSGKEETITFTKNGSEYYTFTTPEDSPLGYVVLVENASVVPEGKTPAIKVTIQQGYTQKVLNQREVGKQAYEINADGKFATTAHQSSSVTVTATNVTEAAEGVTAINAVAKITIKPVTAAALSETAVKVKKGEEPKWYTYTIPADDRYVLDYAVGADQAKDSVLVGWWKVRANGTLGGQVYSGDYLTKGQKLYANAKVEELSSIAEAGVDVTLKTPVKVSAAALTFTDKKAEATVTADDVKDGAVKYYTFKAPEYARYTVALKDGEITSSHFDVDRYDNTKKVWFNYGALEKDEEVLVTVYGSGKLTVTYDAITELTAGTASAEIKLKKDESAAFALKVFKSGYYDFQVSDAKGLDLSAYNCIYNAENKCYFVSYIDMGEDGDRYQFTITNPTETEATLKVTANIMEPVSLKPGENNVPVTKDKAAVVKFKAPESYWYHVSGDTGVSLKESDILLNTDDFYVAGREYSGIAVYTGTEAVTSAKVTISKVTAAPITLTDNKFAISLEAGASKWYQYTADKAGAYSLTIPGNSAVYESLDEYSEVTGSPYRLAANTSLYIRVVNNTDAKLEGDITVTCDAEAKALQVGETQLTSEAETGTTYLTFTAPADGEYKFETTSGDLNYYGETVWKTFVSGTTHLARKGVPVYLTVSATNAKITVTKTADVEVLGHVDVKAGKYQWITFTAPKTGKYTFYSAGNTGDPKAWFFYDDNIGNTANVATLNELAVGEDDDSAGNRNFEIKIALDASETVYIAVGYYNLSSPCACDVYVKY